MDNDIVYSLENIETFRQAARGYREIADNFDAIANLMEQWYDKYVVAGQLLIEILETLSKQKDGVEI